jgi:predicted RNA binding protein YcfA (HicA-like mRNA interferase family)
MVKLIPLKAKEVESILKKNSFYLHHTTGSHKQYRHMTMNIFVTVPYHSKTIPVGTLRSIVRQSGLSIDLFRN